MNVVREFSSIDELVSATKCGFAILHQEPALGIEFRDKDEEFSRLKQRLMQSAEQACLQIRRILGESTDANVGWDIGVPTWASGGGYAMWELKDSFITIFISWDNPEDPSFVIGAKAAIGDFNNDHINLQPDPWQSKWMEKAEW